MREYAAIRVGFKTPNKSIDAATVRQAVVDWKNRGWTRYVKRSASRHGLATKVEPIILGGSLEERV